MKKPATPSYNPLMELFFGQQVLDSEGDETGPVELSLPPTTPLSEARRALDSVADRGAKCPCCDQAVKFVRRGLNAGMAEFLCSLVVRFQVTNDWVSAKDCKYSRHNPYLLYWELVESRKGKEWFWRPTSKGIEFVRGKISVPSHVFVLDKVRRWSETHVSIAQVFEGYSDRYPELVGR